MTANTNGCFIFYTGFIYYRNYHNTAPFRNFIYEKLKTDSYAGLRLDRSCNTTREFAGRGSSMNHYQPCVNIVVLRKHTWLCRYGMR